MALKTANAGHFTIPTAPSAGTAVAQSASANTYGSYVALIASTAAAVYVKKLRWQATTTQVPTYLSVTIGTGGAGSETVVSIADCSPAFTAGAASSQIGGEVYFDPPIPVAISTRIACKTASSAASAISWNLALTVINQADVVDAGVNEQANLIQCNGSTVANGAIPNVAAGGAGGLMISGTNTGPWSVSGGVSFTNSGGSALTLTASGGNGSGIATTGQGLGAGIACFAGASGNGLYATGGATTGHAVYFAATAGSSSGLYVAGSSSNAGIIATGGATGAGLSLVGGATSGDGLLIATTVGHCISGTATGTAKDGLHLVGSAASGANAGGHGISSVGGAASTTGGGTAGVGAKLTGGAGAASNNGAGEGATLAGGGTTTVAGANAVSLTGTGALSGLAATGGATGTGATFTGGGTSGVAIQLSTTSGDGLSITPTAGHALTLTGQGTAKHGVNATGSAAASGNAAGHGVLATGGAATTSSGGTSGVGVKAVGGAGAASTNGASEGAVITGGGTTTVSGAVGLSVAGTGALAGLLSTGGATGPGAKFVGGGTSGDGIDVTVTSGHGVSITATGSSKHGVLITGGDAGTSDGLKLVAGTGGVGFRLDTLTASGAVTLSSTLTVSGTTTCTGNVAMQAGLTVTQSGTGPGVSITGGSVGAALRLTGGTSGDGLLISGGSSSGNGISISTTSGHGVTITAAGASKHGIVTTGGTSGTSDGLKCVAGTGGVDIRGGITGDITGTLATLTTYTGNTIQTGDAYAIVNSATFGNAKLVRATTPANTLDVSAAGEAGLDWANIGSPTTTVGLTGTTISTSQVVASVAGAVGSVTGNVGGNVVGSVASVAGNVGGNVVGSVASVTAAVTLQAKDSPAYATGTATAGGATTITLQTALGTDDLVKGGRVKITSGTGAGQERVATGYVDGTKILTVDRAWTTNPDNTSVYAILYGDQPKLDASLQVTATGSGTFTANVTQWLGVAPLALSSQQVQAIVPDAQKVDLNTIKTQAVTCAAGVTVGAFVGNAAAALGVDASGRVDLGKILGTASAGAAGYVGVDWGQVTNKTTTNALTGTTISTSQVAASVTGNVGGNVTGSVGSVATGGITSGSFAAGAIDAAAIATDAIGAAEFSQAAADKVWATAARTLTAATNITSTGGTITVSGGIASADLKKILGTAPTEGSAGQLAGAFTTFFDVGSPVLTTASVNQTGDSYARIGATGSALTSLAPSATALSTVVWTNARGGYQDNLNVGGLVASQADVLAINQSASRRLVIITVPQYERPETGTTSYTVEVRTYDGDGAAVNADSDPSLTATGIVSGSLSANLSAITNPATGVYRWTYSVLAAATQEQVRFDVSATISSSTFTLATYSQVVDQVSATWTSTDAGHLTSIFNKLPSKAFLAGTGNSSGAVEADALTGNYPGTVAAVTLTATTTAVTNDVGITQAGADKAWSTATRVLTAGTNIVLAKGVGLTGLNDITAAAVWAAATRTLTASLDPTAADIATAVWTDLLAGSDFGTAASIGKLLKDDIDTNIGSRLATSGYTAPDNAGISAISTSVSTLLGRLGAFTGSGVNTMLGFFRALLRTDATLPSDVGGTFDPATDSVEAIRDHGDAAWVTATGFALATDYTAGRAAKLDNLDTTVGSRLATTNYTAPDNTTIAAIYAVVDTEVAAIKAKTDQITFTAANRVDATAAVSGTVVLDASQPNYAPAKAGDAMKLTADGLDSISAAEPTVKPTLFAGWLMWLVQRYRACDLTATTLRVKTEAGATVTSQAVTDDGTVQTVGPPT